VEVQEENKQEEAHPLQVDPGVSVKAVQISGVGPKGLKRMIHLVHLVHLFQVVRIVLVVEEEVKMAEGEPELIKAKRHGGLILNYLGELIVPLSSGQTGISKNW